jgi:hypothetical protein
MQLGCRFAVLHLSVVVEPTSTDACATLPVAPNSNQSCVLLSRFQAQQKAMQQHQQQTGAGIQQQQQQRGAGKGKGWSKWNNPQAWGSQQVPLALVLAPTRELAQQTQQEAERLGANISTV